jgi:hypothetical protein
MKAQIEGKEYVLLVTLNSDLSKHTVRICQSMDEALKNWAASSRSSPLFALNGSSFPDLSRRAVTEFCFFGANLSWRRAL